MPLGNAITFTPTPSALTLVPYIPTPMPVANDAQGTKRWAAAEFQALRTSIAALNAYVPQTLREPPTRPLPYQICYALPPWTPIANTSNVWCYYNAVSTTWNTL